LFRSFVETKLLKIIGNYTTLLEYECNGPISRCILDLIIITD